MQTWFRNCLVLAFFLLISFRASAQAVFDMTMPQKMISNSLYNELVILNSRTDTGSLGMVHVGLMNKATNVITKRSLADQIKTVFNASIDSSAKEGSLLLQLRQFSFAETIKSTQETGYCTFRAKMYRSNGDQYTEVDQIDTLITFHAIDVTKRLYKEGTNLLTSFISRNLTAQIPDGRSLSYRDIEQIDSALPYWLLSCSSGTELGRVTVTSSNRASGRFSGVLNVPARCPVQYLTLVVRPSEQVEGVVGQINTVILRPARL